MNIEKTLLADPVQSRQLAVRVADYACTDEEIFSELMNCFFSEHYRLAQRAAYSAGIAAQKKPELIQPYIGKLAACLTRKDVHDAVIRNSVRILEDVAIPEAFHAEVMNKCFELAADRMVPVAIRALSLTVLYRLSLIYPEIKKELRIIIEEGMEFEKAAFRSRGKKILALIK
ncbi:hypothetical protein FEM33_09690 [Dyadobacter flavalbus]|uniref:HEAT repeat domain-containing protein n=1 Tax=Dyadobacter flavalbus TaxID=2579942 RepID=A0A5M8QUJ9_9BACT|nr:hypothetical protein [Dyadobacter flavalbus]KAA6439965.1 hypothetical protein FEM33_09690 [Dyadobacter flavalbus]